RIINATNVAGAGCTGAGAAGSNVLYLSKGDGSFTSISLPTNISFAQTRMTLSTSCTAWEDANHTVCSWDTTTWTAGANYYLGDFNGDGVLDLVTTSVPAGFARYPDPGPPPPADDPCSTVICTHVYLGSASGGSFAFTEVPTNLTNLAHTAVYAQP